MSLLPRFLPLIGLMAASLLCSGQQSHIVGFSTGVGWAGNQELTLSPYIQKGTVVPISLQYEGGNGKYKVLETGEYAVASTQSSAGSPYKVRQVGLRLGYIRPLKAWKSITPWLGASWNTVFWRTENTYDGFEQATRSLLTAIAVRARFEKVSGAGKFILDIDQSLFGYEDRPGYLNTPAAAEPGYTAGSSEFFSTGYWAGPGKLLITDVSLSWEKGLSTRWLFRGGAFFSYRYAGYPASDQSAAVAGAGLQAALFYKFATKEKGKGNETKGQ